ncbi:hypothetical protein BGZ58_009994 [Dissophora ornata]|nr:hypothetical protein BGZ58_009994 [Dissophora ornata]
MMPDLATHADVGELYSLILGNPQANVDKAITTFVQEFEKMDRAANATQLAKEAFQKDITEAKEAFDQEMVLRHADVVKQYVGACMDLF